MGDHNGVVIPPKSDQIALLKRIYLCFLIFAISHLSLSTSLAAPSATKPQQIQNPKVVFSKGLLTVQAKDVKLKALMDEIGKKAGIQVSVSESLQKKKVTVQFEKLTLETGLKAILQSAGIVNHALVYGRSKEEGRDKWAIERIFLEQKGVTKAVMSGNAIEFLDEKGNIRKRLQLLQTIPGKSWSRVSKSKNEKYIAINNVYNYDQKMENIEDAEMIMLNDEGDELWRMKHNLANIIPSPNGKYIVGVPDAALGDAPISVFNDKGLIIKEIEKDDQAWKVGFSKDGSFFAVTVVTFDKSKTGVEKYQGHLIVVDGEGNELWRKENLATGSSSFFEVDISDEDIVSATINFPKRIIYRFDNQGNLLGK